MGKILIISIAFFLSMPAFANIKSLAIENGVKQEDVINYVQNNIPKYKNDPTVANCLKKLDEDSVNALYSLFNYIVFKNFEGRTEIGNKTSDLKNIKKMMKLGQEAKKGIIYCNG